MDIRDRREAVLVMDKLQWLVFQKYMVLSAEFMRKNSGPVLAQKLDEFIKSQTASINLEEQNYNT